DPGDLLGAQPRQLLRAPPPLRGRLAARAVDLRRALTDPLPAVRALGHIRAHLGAAVLADDEQVWLRHGLPQSTRRAAPVRRLFAGGLGGLGDGRVEDLANHLAQVVIGLVDGALARRPVALVQDVLDAVEVVLGAQLLGVR